MIWALVIGAAIGTIPSADAIARVRGHDLRSSGSGNPGTANALRVAGKGVAAVVLIVDLTKGAVAAVIGGALAGDGGTALAGLAAIAGQIHNPWFGFAGGKGLGVTIGVTAVAWPPGLLVVMPFTLAGAVLLKAAWGAVFGLVAYLIGAVVWAGSDWPMLWGIAADDRLVWLAIGVVILATPKFIADISRRR